MMRELICILSVASCTSFDLRSPVCKLSQPDLKPVIQQLAALALSTSMIVTAPAPSLAAQPTLDEAIVEFAEAVHPILAAQNTQFPAFTEQVAALIFGIVPDDQLAKSIEISIDALTSVPSEKVNVLNSAVKEAFDGMDIKSCPVVPLPPKALVSKIAQTDALGMVDAARLKALDATWGGTLKMLPTSDAYPGPDGNLYSVICLPAPSQLEKLALAQAAVGRSIRTEELRAFKEYVPAALKAIKPTDDKNGYPKQFDTAAFSIPARGGPGMYIIQYFWRGYRDCIDVQVVEGTGTVGTSSGAMFGIGPLTTDGTDSSNDGGVVTAPTETTYNMAKVDHCQYRKGLYTLLDTAGGGADVCHPIPPPDATNSQGQTRDAALEACKERCKADNGCEAVNLVPAASPASIAFGGAAYQNVPWDDAACPQAAFAAEPAGTSVCYGFLPADVETETSELFVIVDNDPQDEIFFSTCYRKVALSGFDLLLPPTPPPPPPPAPWRVGPYCLSCEDTQTAPLTGYWELADTCEMCWRENLTLPPGIPGGPTLVVGDSGADVSSGSSEDVGIGVGVGVAVLLLLGLAAAAGIVFYRRRKQRGDLATSTLSIPNQGKAAAEMVPPPPAKNNLPPGWSAVVDPDSGSTYYANATTGETQWHKPETHV